MRFNELGQTPYVFVVRVTCPNCAHVSTPDPRHSTADNNICPNCNVRINLRYTKNAERFYSINLLNGKCPYCSNNVSPTYIEKKNGHVNCRNCEKVFEIWLLDKAEYEKRTDFLLNEIDNLIERNDLEAVLSMIEAAIGNEKEIIGRRLGRSNWIYSFTDVLSWVVSFTPRWMNLHKIIVIPILHLLSRIFVGKRVDKGISYLNTLIYKKVLIRANVEYDFDQFDLVYLLKEVYLFLILVETSDFEVFYNQLISYLNQNADPRKINELIDSINFFFEISVNKDEEWLEIFWSSLASIVSQFQPESILIRNIRSYYRHLGYFGEDSLDHEEEISMLTKYEEILGIKWDGSNQFEIKKKYRELVSIYHPDKPSGDDTKFQEVQEAYIFFKSRFGKH